MFVQQSPSRAAAARCRREISSAARSAVLQETQAVAHATAPARHRRRWLRLVQPQRLRVPECARTTQGSRPRARLLRRQARGMTFVVTRRNARWPCCSTTRVCLSHPPHGCCALGGPEYVACGSTVTFVAVTVLLPVGPADERGPAAPAGSAPTPLPLLVTSVAVIVVAGPDGAALDTANAVAAPTNATTAHSTAMPSLVCKSFFRCRISRIRGR